MRKLIDEWVLCIDAPDDFTHIAFEPGDHLWLLPARPAAPDVHRHKLLESVRVTTERRQISGW